MIPRFNYFRNDEAGATSIEYALIAVLISIFIIGAVTSLGAEVHALFNKVDTTVSSAIVKV